MKLNLTELVNFFDTKNSENIGHVSSINGVIGEDLMLALLKNYLGKLVDELVFHTEKPTQGARGFRLDKWIEIQKDGSSFLYQTEIKNWTSHSLRGIEHPLCLEPQKDIELSLKKWNNRFDINKMTLKDKEARKVLAKMKPFKNQLEVRPLICFWEPMNPDGTKEEFFNVTVNSENFDSLDIFSASNHVRNLITNGNTTLECELPEVENRLASLSKFLL